MQLYISFILNSSLLLLLSISLGFAVFRLTVIRSFQNRLKSEIEYSSVAYLYRLAVRYSRVFILSSFLVSIVIFYFSFITSNMNVTYIIENLVLEPLLVGIVYLMMEIMLFPLMNHYYEITRSIDSKKNDGIPVHVRVLREKIIPVDSAVLVLMVLALLVLH
ncbi:MAG: hypothetical protein AAE977_03930 [Thermoplasmataceae archaeon]|jgi:hypothetical protein